MYIKFLNRTLEIHDGNRLRKITKAFLDNCLIERRLGRDLMERYPPASS